jgi:hypothetical protein
METTNEERQSRRGSHAFQPMAGIVAGLIMGVWFLIFPRGVPWSSVNFFSAAVLGRVMPESVSYISATLLHFALCALYGIVIAAVVRRTRAEWAILMGAVTGLLLYLLNLAVVYNAVHSVYGREAAVLIAHVLFGAFTAGVYRGFISRRRALSTDSRPIEE